MAKIAGLRIKNFRSLKDVTLGRLWNQQQAEALTSMTAVIGKNGVGKSTLFDAFGFLADALKSGVEETCDSRGRGGFERIRAQDQKEPIEFEVYYKEDGNARPITYELAIDADRSGRPYVLKERLRQRRRGQKRGWPFSFLMLDSGKGLVWKGDQEDRQIDSEYPWRQSWQCRAVYAAGTSRAFPDHSEPHCGKNPRHRQDRYGKNQRWPPAAAL